MRKVQFTQIIMLKTAGYINITIAFGHLAGLIWSNQVFALFGISKQMNALSQIHSSFPYLLTILVALVFFAFGLYGLSGAGKIKRLPLLEPVTFIIGGIYLFRGLGELIYETTRTTHSLAEMTYSLIAVAIGLLYLIGALEKRRTSRRKVANA